MKRIEKKELLFTTLYQSYEFLKYFSTHSRINWTCSSDNLSEHSSTIFYSELIISKKKEGNKEVKEEN